MPIPSKYKIDIITMLKSCVGIQTYCETYNCNETYFKISDLKLYIEGHKLLAKYMLPDCTAQVQADLESAGYHIISDINEKGDSKYYWKEDHSKIIKDAGNKTNESYEDAIIDR